MFVVKRSLYNPIISPTIDHPWESFAAFNWCPIQDDEKFHCVYRAMSEMKYIKGHELSLSTIGYGVSKDGHWYEPRKPLITPKYEWERYGCEDPRVTKIEDTYYIFYTALGTFPFRAEGIRIAVAVTKDFETIDERHLVTPFNAKAMALFPEKIDGKYVALLAAHTDMPPVKICLAEFDSIEQIWSTAYWDKWHAEIESHRMIVRRTEHDQVEIGAVPLKTKEGWLVIYSHIQNYFSDNKIFGIEALLLDLNDPKKIIARTDSPLLIPEETYEEFVQIPNVIFPSGATIKGEELYIYYGATDTTCCRADVNLQALLKSMRKEPVVTRHKKNPILEPLDNHPWENKAVFNPAAVAIDGKVHIVYRAMGDDDTSVLGYAYSKDGLSITERVEHPIYVPRESFEKKVHPGNSGCEDPRITQIDDMLYMFYTAYDGVHPPAVAATSISVKNFLKKNWDWSWPAIITPADVDDKDSCLFPEKIGDNYLVFHRTHDHICLDPIKSLEFDGDRIDTFTPIIGPRKGMWDGRKVGIASVPIKTGKGWLLLYHGVSDEGVYRVGALLLDLHNPMIVLARTTDYIFAPETDYEKNGIIPNVVFPCGSTVIGKKLFIYYGGADRVVGVATANIDEIVDALTFD